MYLYVFLLILLLFILYILLICVFVGFVVVEQVFMAQKSTMVDLSRHCHDGNALVRPEKGKAVMWYNHVIDEETGAY